MKLIIVAMRLLTLTLAVLVSGVNAQVQFATGEYANTAVVISPSGSPTCLGYCMLSPWPSIPKGLTSISSMSLSTGDSQKSDAGFACAVVSNRVQCWSGINGNAWSQATVPSALETSTSATAVSCGYMHTCAVASSQLHCWGCNLEQQMEPPDAISSSTAVSAVSCGKFHTCAISSGRLFCWGNDSDGALDPPPAVANSTAVSAVSCGFGFTCAIVFSQLYCWGGNADGELNVPAAVKSSTSVSAVSCGNSHACAVAGSKLYCWGDNSAHQIEIPSPVSSSTEVASVSCTYKNTCAVAGNLMICWGDIGDAETETFTTTAVSTTTTTLQTTTSLTTSVIQTTQTRTVETTSSETSVSTPTTTLQTTTSLTTSVIQTTQTKTSESSSSETSTTTTSTSGSVAPGVSHGDAGSVLCIVVLAAAGAGLGLGGLWRWRQARAAEAAESEQTDMGVLEAARDAAVPEGAVQEEASSGLLGGVHAVADTLQHTASSLLALGQLPSLHLLFAAVPHLIPVATCLYRIHQELQASAQADANALTVLQWTTVAFKVVLEVNQCGCSEITQEALVPVEKSVEKLHQDVESYLQKGKLRRILALSSFTAAVADFDQCFSRLGVVASVETLRLGLAQARVLGRVESKIDEQHAMLKKVLRSQEKQTVKDTEIEMAEKLHLRPDQVQIDRASCLGEGATAKVYQALYEGELVAAKVVNLANESRRTQKEIQNAIELEAGRMLTLSHPNVIRIFGIIHQADTAEVMMIMEFAAGGTLRKLLDQRHGSSVGLQSELEIEDAREKAIQIARGMSYLHSSHNLAHRDLKSPNILVMETGKLKVSDFGLAAVQSSLASMVSRVHSSQGSTRWMAPEVIDEEFAPRTPPMVSDVYSYGVVLFELLTGEVPWEGCSDAKILGNVRYKDLRPDLQALVPPSALADLMRRCWDKEPAKRPNFSEILSELS